MGCGPLTPDIVAGGQHGRELVRHRCAGKVRLPHGLCGCHSGLRLLQSPRRHDRLLLLVLWSRVRTAPDGAVAVLVWMVGHKIQ